MAGIEKRTSKDGRTAAWRVKWRVGGTRDGAQDGETYDDLKTARHFKVLVEAAGEQAGLLGGLPPVWRQQEAGGHPDDLSHGHISAFSG